MVEMDTTWARGYDKGYKSGRQHLLIDMRDKWCYDSAYGHPVFSIRLDDWIHFIREAGLTNEKWWELKQED